MNMVVVHLPENVATKIESLNIDLDRYILDLLTSHLLKEGDNDYIDNLIERYRINPDECTTVIKECDVTDIRGWID